MDMKLNYKRKEIFYGVLLAISIANAFIMPNIKKISVIDLVLVIVPIIFLFFAYFSNKSDYNDYISSEKINSYILDKDKIDKLNFNNPVELADYFYKKFKFSSTPDFVLRLVIFAYNYFNIDKLKNDDSTDLCASDLFYETFDNPNELKKYVDVPSNIDINPHVISYIQLKDLIWCLFGDQIEDPPFYNVFDENVLKEYECLSKERENNYSFIKSEIDKLGFKTPSQMAEYFYEKFDDAPSFECTLRMAVFAYNYFKIEERYENGENFICLVTWFNESFKNSDKFKKYVDVPSTLEVEKYIKSYESSNLLVYELFEDSDLGTEYWDLFDIKHDLQK